MKFKGRYLTFFKTYVRPHLKLVIALIFLSLISVSFAVIAPLIMRSLVDQVIIKGEVRPLTDLSIILLLTFFSSCIARYFSTYLSGKLSVEVTNGIREGVFNRLQYKKLNSIYKIKSGDIMSRVMNDINQCQHIFTTYVIQFFSRAVWISLPLAIMLTLRWDLALICVSSTIVYSPITLFFGRILKRKQKTVLQSIARMYSFVKEAFSIFPLTKAYELEDYQQKRFSKILGEYYNSIISVYKTEALSVFMGTFLISFPVVVLYYIGGGMVINGIITIGTLVAFSIYIVQFYSPIRGLVNLWTNIKMSTASFERITEVMEMEEEESGKEELFSSNERIAFENVTFSYENKLVFKDITITFKKGTNFLLGDNGTGKTTILHLIIRLYTPDKGVIKIDGQDINKVKLGSFRKNVSILAQDVQLLDTTILENIWLGNLNASAEEIIAAAKSARVHEFILKLPKGYNTQVGEEGLSLSGGEKQKIALARAILKGAHIILLDEVTTSIDEESKKSIHETLREIASEKILVIATHDRSWIREEDNVMDLNLLKTGLNLRTS